MGRARHDAYYQFGGSEQFEAVGQHMLTGVRGEPQYYYRDATFIKNRVVTRSPCANASWDTGT
jgi:hypothetical protein